MDTILKIPLDPLLNKCNLLTKEGATTTASRGGFFRPKNTIYPIKHLSRQIALDIVKPIVYYLAGLRKLL
jgi:hypothetical protein